MGVYFSEELKYARKLGYEVTLLSGYSFEMKDSPFTRFVESVYEKREEAKRTGKKEISFFYKLLMNSLYGRFGINPKCSITEICDFDRLNELLMDPGFYSSDQLSELYYIVNYYEEFSDWSPPRISAVYLSAAITAYARIHMYPYISRPDCYYTDTDSVVLGSPLQENEISKTELGKFKLEHEVIQGLFLAPKTYIIDPKEGPPIIKHKGVAKYLVTKEWFEKQYDDIYHTDHSNYIKNFHIDWSNLNITKKDIEVHLGI